MSSAPLPSRLEVVFPPDPFNLTPAPDLTGFEKAGYIAGNEAFASPDLKDEIERARARGGLAVGAVYHGTRSVALTGIGLHKSILSSRRLIELGYDITTGEMSEPIGSVHRSQNGLEDVYACRSAASTNYAFPKRGEYPVIFGIHNIRVWDAYGDGLKLGPRVPLSNVTSITVPYEQLSATDAWSREYCRPDTLVISQEAALLLSQY